MVRQCHIGGDIMKEINQKIYSGFSLRKSKKERRFEVVDITTEEVVYSSRLKKKAEYALFAVEQLHKKGIIIRRYESFTELVDTCAREKIISFKSVSEVFGFALNLFKRGVQKSSINCG